MDTNVVMLTALVWIAVVTVFLMNIRNAQKRDDLE